MCIHTSSLINFILLSRVVNVQEVLPGITLAMSKTAHKSLQVHEMDDSTFLTLSTTSAADVKGCSSQRTLSIQCETREERNDILHGLR